MMYTRIEWIVECLSTGELCEIGECGDIDVLVGEEEEIDTDLVSV